MRFLNICFLNLQMYAHLKDMAQRLSLMHLWSPAIFLALILDLSYKVWKKIRKKKGWKNKEWKNTLENLDWPIERFVTDNGL